MTGRLQEKQYFDQQRTRAAASYSQAARKNDAL